MDLTLNVLRCPDSAVPESRRSSGADLTIGRGLECDWTLPDPDRLLSKRHCTLEFRGGFWQVRDVSTNGTFVNHADQPIGRDLVAPLSDGDRLRLGPWEIEVRIAEGASAGGWRPSTPAGQPSPDPFGDPLGTPMANAAPLPSASYGATSGGFGGGEADPFAAQAPSGFSGGGFPGGGFPGGGFAGGGFAGGGGGGGGLIPDDFGLDDLAPVADHQAAATDAFTPPRATPVSKLPDDWDLGFDLAAPAPAPATTPAPAPMATPVAAPARPPIAAPVAVPVAPVMPPPIPPPVAAPPPVAPAAASALAAEPDFLADPFAEEHIPAQASPPPVSIPVAPPSVAPVATAPLDFVDLSAPAIPAQAIAAQAIPVTPLAPSVAPPVPPPVAPPMAPVAPPAPAPVAGPAATDALAALLQGAGLPASALPPGTDPHAALVAAGAALRAAVGGLRALLIARADVKREFRIEQTMLRSAGNNPLKFAPDDEAAMVALLRHATGPRAVQETVDDLTAHQVAALAATQAGARALLQRLAPEGLEAQDQGGGLFSGSKEKRMWEAFKRLHGQVTDQFEDDFDSAFGKEFARAYEQATRRD